MPLVKISRMFPGSNFHQARSGAVSSTPRSVRAEVEKEAISPCEGARQAPVQAPAPREEQNLNYLRQWVELEEARLDMRQTPPGCPDDKRLSGFLRRRRVKAFEANSTCQCSSCCSLQRHRAGML
eukprot:s1367_g5.t1